MKNEVPGEERLGAPFRCGLRARPPRKTAQDLIKDIKRSPFNGLGCALLSRWL